MKSALELQAIANLRAEEKQIEKIKEEKRQDLKIQIDTIKLCERIGKKIEEKAIQGESPADYLYIDLCGRVLYETNAMYADKRISYEPTQTQISVKVIEAWFKQYGFKINVNSFKYYCYDIGLRVGYKIDIEPIENYFLF